MGGPAVTDEVPMRVVPLLVVAVLCFGCGAHSGRAKPEGADSTVPIPDDAELRRVQARAKYIFDAERAAIFATDRLLTQDALDHSRMEWFFTVPREDGWYSLFGSVDDAGTFTPAYAFKAPRDDAEQMAPLPLDALPGDFSPVARAVKASMLATVEAFERGAINPVVYVEEDGDLTVYVLQGTQDPRRFYLGGDLRFRYSPDGRTQREAVRLHQSVFAISLEPGPEGELYQGSVHSHVLFGGPLETELATLMLYPELGALTVVHAASRIAYFLTPDGAIRVLSEAPERQRILKPDGTFGPLDMEEDAAPAAPSGQVDL
ncbi:putative lipoprotein [Corallococcus macrosporus]|nr:putative lipoprotein [Corallococcus macrosporus]